MANVAEILELLNGVAEVLSAVLESLLSAGKTYATNDVLIHP